MNHRILERLWRSLSKSQLGRFTAAAIIGALFALFAAAKQSAERSSLAISAAVGAVIGIVAAAILEAVDSGRSKHRSHNRRSRRQAVPPDIQSPIRRTVPPPLPVRPHDSPPQ